MLGIGAEPWQVLRVLAPFEGAPRTRTAWLRSEGWLRVARREGPSAHAETWLRQAFESGLEDLKRYPTLYERQIAAVEDELVWLSVAQPFAPWFEYLVMFGRFAEAREVRARAVEVLGPGLVAKPRVRIKALIDLLASMATPDIFERARQPDFLPRLAATTDCEASELRVEALSKGALETIVISLPVPIFNREALWFAFTREAGTANVRVFTMEWIAEEWAARGASWKHNDPISVRAYGPSIAPGAAPRPSLGTASPYLPAFMDFIEQQTMLDTPLRAPIPTLVPRSVPPPLAPPPRQTALVVLGVLLFLNAALGVWQLLSAAHHDRGGVAVVAD